MSKRTFVILGLTVNLIICIAISVIHFAGTETKQTPVAEFTTTKEDEESNILAENKTEKNDNETTVSPTEITTESNETEPTTSAEVTTEQPTSPEVTTEQVTSAEATTEQPTPPEVTTEQVTSAEVTTEQPTTSEPSTTPAYIQGKTKVQIQSSCNIRSTPELSAPVIGTTKAGEEYALITTKCDDYWLAISYNGITGYISNDFGLLLP